MKYDTVETVVRNAMKALTYIIRCEGEEEVFTDIFNLNRVWGEEEVYNYFFLNTREMIINIK